MAKLKDGFYKLTAEAVGSDSYMLLAGGGSKALSDFATASGVVTALGTNGNYVTWTKNGTANNLRVPYATSSHSAKTLNTGELPSSTSNKAETVWCKFATLTFNDGAYSCVSGYLFFSGVEMPGFVGILHYHFRADKDKTQLGSANLKWLVNTSLSILVISVKTADNVYDLYVNNYSTWVTPRIHNMMTIGSFVWNIGSWTTTKPTVSHTATLSGMVNYATSAGSVAWGNITGKPSFATVATSGSYNDLSNKPTVGNGTITINLAGKKVGSFSLNSTSNTTIDLTDVNTWRGITDSTSTTSSAISASATAVKSAYDKAVAAYNLANGKTANTGTVTSITLTAGSGISITNSGTAITTSGTRTITNTGVRSTTINGNYLRVNTNGTNTDLTIPYATNADKVDGLHAQFNKLYYTSKSVTMSTVLKEWYIKIVLSAYAQPTLILISGYYNNQVDRAVIEMSGMSRGYIYRNVNQNGGNIQAICYKTNYDETEKKWIFWVKLRQIDNRSSHYAPSSSATYTVYLSDNFDTFDVTATTTAPTDVTWDSVNSTNTAITLKNATLHGNADSATTASKLGSSTLGSTYEPIYLSSGTATKGTSYAKAIKGITRSGTTFTYTCIDGTTGTFTLLDNNSDTKVTQTVTSSNATYPLLLAPSGQTATTTTTSYFDSGVTLNPSTNTITANITGSAGSVAWGNVTGKPSSYTPSAHDHTSILFIDDRNVVETPTDVAGKNGIEIHFKDKSKSGITSTGPWTAVVMLDGYSDTSGGYPMELGFSMSDLSESRPLYLRTPKSATEWGGWRTVLDSNTYKNFINTTNFPGLNKTGTVTSVKVGSTSYSPSSGVVSLPAYPTSLKSPNAIKFKKTDGTTVTYDGSSAADLTGGVNYATSAGNADTVDSKHASDFEAYKCTVIDTTGLNENTWYPVTFDIGCSLQTRVRVEGITSTTGSWNNRSDKTMAVLLDYVVQGSAWGWITPTRIVYDFELGAGAGGTNCVAGLGLLINSSTEYVYVRGGAKYNFYISRFITPVLRTTSYTVISQTIAPTTTSPAAITINNALKSDLTWSNVSGKPSFATVATSGSYNDLSNKPSIPTVTNYYWANVKVSSNSNTATTPTFSTIATTGVSYVATLRPSTTETHFLGSSTYRWNNVFSKLGNFSGQIISSVATGTSPFSIASTTVNANLNADMVDGKHASDFATSGHTHSYLPLSGGTMTGNIKVYTDGDGRGLKFGTSTLNSLSNQLLWQSAEAIRFGSSSWDWDAWAGLKYKHSSKIIYLGLADGTIFNANTALSGGKLYLPGISEVYTGNGTNKIWHAGNDGSGSGLDADTLDGYHIWVGTRSLLPGTKVNNTIYIII